MNKTSPKVSVIMPVYNAEQYLQSAVNSILEQSFTDFELIAIDDGSTDNSGAILDEYSKQDNRIIVLHQENQGVVATANKALGIARGAYIARQDSDDISFRTRLEHQVAILEKHPEVILVTGSFEVFDEDDEYLYREVLPTQDMDIKRAMYLRNPIGHGSVLIRREVFAQAGHYNEATGGIAEDYDFFLRISALGEFRGTETATYRWRVNLQGLTHTNNTVMKRATRQHVDALWARNPPTVLGSRELRRRGNYYFRNYTKRGIAMKNMMLADNAQLAVKMIRRGQVLRGCRQMVAVFLVGRSGIRAVYYRLRAIQRGTAGAIRRRASVGRRDANPHELES